MVYGIRNQPYRMYHRVQDALYMSLISLGILARVCACHPFILESLFTLAKPLWKSVPPPLPWLGIEDHVDVPLSPLWLDWNVSCKEIHQFNPHILDAYYYSVHKKKCFEMGKNDEATIQDLLEFIIWILLDFNWHFRLYYFL